VLVAAWVVVSVVAVTALAAVALRLG